MMLADCALENAFATSASLNTDGLKTDGLKTDGEKTLGLNTDGLKTDGLKTDGEKTLGLNTDGLKTDGLKTDGEKTLGLNTARGVRVRAEDARAEDRRTEYRWTEDARRELRRQSLQPVGGRWHDLRCELRPDVAEDGELVVGCEAAQADGDALVRGDREAIPPSAAVHFENVLRRGRRVEGQWQRLGQAALSAVVRMHSDGAGVIALAGDVTVTVTNCARARCPARSSKRT